MSDKVTFFRKPNYTVSLITILKGKLIEGNNSEFRGYIYFTLLFKYEGFTKLVHVFHVNIIAQHFLSLLLSSNFANTNPLSHFFLYYFSITQRVFVVM